MTKREKGNIISMNLCVTDKKELSKPEIRKIAELLIATWPPKDENINVEKVIDFYTNENLNSFNKVLLYYNADELIGHAEIFNREIIIESEKKEILALAGVCVKQSFRGKNIGAELVKQAFGYVDNGQFKCSVFQTNVPKFYVKLNCKQIYNTFINSKNDNDINKNPWRDPYIMVYPENYNPGNSIIDLNGNCY